MDIETIGLTASIISTLMFISTIDQIRDIIKYKTSQEVSPVLYGMMILNGMFWVIYGFGINNIYIIVPNSVGFFLGLATLIVILKYRSIR